MYKLIGRQGDIYVYRSDKKFDSGYFSRTPSAVVARGEKTGHAHVLTGNDLAVAPYIIPNPGIEGTINLFAKVGDVAVLTHDEHPPVEIPAGDYAFVQQREADWDRDDAVQAVVD